MYENYKREQRAIIGFLWNEISDRRVQIDELEEEIRLLEDLLEIPRKALKQAEIDSKNVTEH